MSRVIPFLLAALLSAPLVAAPLEYFLPEGGPYDASVPTPEAVIGHEVGEWHITHDRLARYMEVLAETSDRVRWYRTGSTHEGRPLLLLAISSPGNLARLDAIHEARRALTDPRRPAPDFGSLPAVAWMGYSVHGDEPSGANAAPVVAYRLAAAQDQWTRRLLDTTVVLFDPSVNPDGLQRYSTWVNSHRGAVPVADPQSREHNQAWPSGRTNHYWFDLNRDWLLLVHPESQARVREFQHWRPNVLTDFHEMGSDATYFFQPGVPSRQHPLFPQRTFDLTLEIARYHAEALDRDERLYYSREGFDDFYLGKGSTYPDIHGSIGILFEQAGMDGHLKDTDQGEHSFAFAIRNQVTTSFSTLRAVVDKRESLLRWQREFYESALAEGGRDDAGGWVFGDDGDPVRAQRFIEVLLAHGIEVHELARETTVDGQRYRPGGAWLVPAAQPQYRLARALFERRTEFEDTTFYDVSAWTLPLAYGLPYAETGRRDAGRLAGERLTAAPAPATAPVPEGAYAYAFEWDGYFAPRAAYRLLEAGVRVRVATKAFTGTTAGGARTFRQGAVVVPMGIQDDTVRQRVHGLLVTAAAEDGVTVHGLTTGFAQAGVDVGSPSLDPIALPKVAIVVGDGVSQYEAGEVWHLLDHRFRMPVSLLEITDLDRADLGRYTHLVMVDGRYDGLGDTVTGRIKSWVGAGGVLFAAQRAMRWAADAGIADAAFVERPEPTTDRRDYAEARPDRELQLIGGAIFATDLDTTHPLGWGVPRREFPVFRDSSLFLKPATDRYATVARYTEQPLLAGYISPENLDLLAGTAAIVAQRKGRGTVVLAANDLNFRGFWYGSSRVFLNTLYFSGLIADTARD